MVLDRGAVEAVFQRVESEGRGTLMEHEVYALLQAAGLSVPAHRLFSSPEEIAPEALAALPGPEVVAKVASPRILHKTEFGGVKVVPREPGPLRALLAEFQERARLQGLGPVGLLVCEKVELAAGPGAELLLSCRVDRAFGPVIAFGLGGLLTEYWGKNLRAGRSLALRSTRGFGPGQARSMVEGTAAGDFLAGRVRGQKAPLAPEGAAARAVLALAGLAEAFSPLERGAWTLEELEVNPIAVTRNGELVALDGLGRFSREKHVRPARPLAALRALLEPASVLVIGASGRSMNPGRIILRNLLASPRFSAANLFLLHPKETEIDGIPCAPNPSSLPDGIDMAVVTVPASEATVDLLSELAAAGKVRAFTLISSGFGETAAGGRLQQRLERAVAATRARPDGGVVVNGPNCLGIVSGPGAYNTFFLPPYKLAVPPARAAGANLATVSQSGAFLVVQISRQGGYLAPRYSISFGNQVDVSVSDYVRYLAGDDAVQVISVYVEGFQPYDGRALLEGAEAARAAGKRVILYKTGRTAAGAKAASSHTAAIAGDYAVAEQCFAAAGILAAPDLETFEEWTELFALLGGRGAGGRRLGFMTNAGFETTVGSDRLGCLELAEFAPATWERLRAALPAGIIDFRNPIDASPQCTTAQFLECAGAIAEDAGVDCLVISAVPCTPALDNLPPAREHGEDLYREGSFANGLIRLFRRTEKPLVAVVDAGEVYDPLVRLLREGGVPTFRKIDRAMLALSTYVARQRE